MKRHNVLNTLLGMMLLSSCCWLCLCVHGQQTEHAEDALGTSYNFTDGGTNKTSMDPAPEVEVVTTSLEQETPTTTTAALSLGEGTVEDDADVYYMQLFETIHEGTMDSDFNTRVSDTKEKLSQKMNFLRQKEETLREKERELDEVDRLAFESISKLRGEVAELKAKLLEKVREGRELKHILVSKDAEIAQVKAALKEKDLNCLKKEKEREKLRWKAREERIHKFENGELSLEDVVFGE